jgi:hypothetical protein
MLRAVAVWPQKSSLPKSPLWDVMPRWAVRRWASSPVTMRPISRYAKTCKTPCRASRYTLGFLFLLQTVFTRVLQLMARGSTRIILPCMYVQYEVHTLCMHDGTYIQYSQYKVETLLNLRALQSLPGYPLRFQLSSPGRLRLGTPKHCDDVKPPKNPPVPLTGCLPPGRSSS